MYKCSIYEHECIFPLNQRKYLRFYSNSVKEETEDNAAVCDGWKRNVSIDNGSSSNRRKLNTEIFQ